VIIRPTKLSHSSTDYDARGQEALQNEFSREISLELITIETGG
jgi:hypothetical protein